MSSNRPSTQEPGDRNLGRARLKVRDNILSFMIGAGLILGFILGFVVALSEDSLKPMSRETAWLAVAVFVALVTLGQIWFYRFVDEVEVKDNLWANTIGLHCALTGGVAWVFLNEFGYAPPVNGWWALAAVIGVSALAYIVLKIRRFF